MVAPMGFYTTPTSSYDVAGSRREVQEYGPPCAPMKPQWLAEADPERLRRLEQRVVTRVGDAPYQDTKPGSKRRRVEPDTSTRFEITGVRHAVVEPFNGSIYVKIRDYMQLKGGNFWASPRGINLKLNEWKTLVEMMPAITRAVEELEDQQLKKMKRDSDDHDVPTTPAASAALVLDSDVVAD